MKPTTRLAPQRRAARQTLKGALQRLTMTLMLVMLTSMSAWADESGLFDVNRFSWEYVTATQTLTIQHVSGSTDMTDFEYSGIRKWDSYKNNIQHLVIGSGITYIGKYAFKNLPALQDVTFEPDERDAALESENHWRLGLQCLHWSDERDAARGSDVHRTKSLLRYGADLADHSRQCDDYQI